MIIRATFLSPFLIRLAMFGIALLLSACSTIVPTPQGASGKTLADDLSLAQVATQAWSRVLSQHVNELGWVDFAAIAKEPQDLHTMIRFVAEIPAASLGDRNAQLAHHINAYNALSMFNVIESGIPQSNASLVQRYRFFIARKHRIGGQVMSLYDYENKIIRAYGEPRIHWALNCSALSCPVLPREPFVAVRLEEQLEFEAKKFFADPRNMRADENSRSVYLSEILSFFPEDFVPMHAPNLIAYANRYAPVAADTSWFVRFTPYDWTIANWRR